MNAPNFSQPSRQSAKGIIVIFGLGISKFIKATIIIIIAFFIKYIQSDKILDFANPKVIVSILIILLLFLTIAILRYRNFMFHVNESYFVLKSGIINKEEISVSKSKIQNVYIKQNLLQQLINVVSLSIETAGDDKTEIEISALQKPKALALKALLLSEIKVKGITEESQIEDTPVFFKASLKLLFFEGISENHIKSFLFIFAFIMSIYNDLKDVVAQINISSRFNSWFQLDEQSLLSMLFFNITIVVFLIFASFLFSLIRTVIQNFDLTVIKEADGLEISKGLFNKINLSLKTARIQTATIGTNRFKLALGLYQLAFTQAMVNKKQKQKFNIIGLSLTKINALIEEFYPLAFSNIIKNKPDKYMIYRLFFIALIPLLILNALFALLPQASYLLNIPILIFIITGAIYSYRKKYYSIDDTYIIIGGGGFIDTTTSVLEIHKTQAVTVQQTIFQKNRKLASVKIYSAGKFLTIPQIKYDTACSIKNYLLYKVEFEDKDWM
jgi:putative membrane protein